LITATTSIPVFNAIVKGLGLSGSIPKIAPPEDVVAHHNRFQLWIGVLIGFLSGLAQFFRYHQTEFSGQYKGFVLKHLGISFGLAAILTPLIIWPTGIQAWQYWLLVGSGIFAVLSNADYVWSVLRNKLKLAGSAFAHVGFGALMVGAVFSGALKDPISEGFTSVDDALQGLTKQTNKNVLVVRNTPTKIKGGYEVTYNETWSEGNAQFFALHFIQRDPQGNLLDSFTTYPNVLREIQPSGQPKFQASNPDTKHHLSKDIFTLAVPNWAFQDPEAEQRKRDSLEQTWKLHTIAVGDTFFTQKQFVVLRGVETKVPPIQGYEPQEGDIAVALKLEAHRIVSEDSVQVTAAMPLYYIRGNKPADVSAVLHEQSLTLRFTRIFPNENKFQVAVLEYAPEREYVVVQALVFPGINLVWLGASLMTLGLTIAMALRIKEKWKIEQEEEQVA
jgi:cytochrome c-type biogenesis protein CcmF